MHVATIYPDLVFVKFPKGRYSLESMALVILSVIWYFKKKQFYSISIRRPGNSEGLFKNVYINI